MVGGLVAIANSGSTANNLYSVVTVTGNSIVGGLIGDNNAVLTNSYSNSNVIANNNATHIGGTGWL